MKNIVFKDHGESFVSITNVSEFSKVSTKAIVKAIRSNSEKFASIGLSLPSDVTLKGTILNEHQATFLLNVTRLEHPNHKPKFIIA